MGEKSSVIKSTMCLNESFEWYKGFDELWKGGKYENLLVELMNKSKRIFPHQYTHNEKQSSGEPDFYDLTDGSKYEAKLIINNSQGKMLLDRDNTADSKRNWIITVNDEIIELGEGIIVEGQSKTIDNTLYSIIKNTLQSKVNSDENAIFILPFPMLHCESENMIFMKFAKNIFTIIEQKLNEENVIGNRKVFFIYPNELHKMVLRQLGDSRIEVVDSPEFNKYFTYTSTGLKGTL